MRRPPATDVILLASTLGYLAGVPARAIGQAPTGAGLVPLAATERRFVTSHLNGTQYQLDIALPPGYAGSTKRYPVLYMVNTELFALAAESFRWVRDGNLIPQDLIVVGVGYRGWQYGSWSDENVRNRERDFGITDATTADPPGAAAFLRVLRTEIAPFIDSTFRTNPTDRGLLGHEQGAMFAIYTLLHAPEAFQKYGIGSPAIDRGPDRLDPAAFKWEAAYAASHTSMPARVYMYNGDDVDTWESMGRPVAQQFWSRLESRHYRDLDLTGFEVFTREGHSSVNLLGFGHAIRALYSRPSLDLPEATLQRYVGKWRSDAGKLVTIRLVNHRLVYYGEPARRFSNWPNQVLISELGAESDTAFFATRAREMDQFESLVFTHGQSQNGTWATLRITEPGRKPETYRRGTDRRDNEIEHAPTLHADSLALAQTVSDYVEATHRRDLDGELRPFADDATFITTSGRYIVGKQQLEAFYKGLVGTTDSIRYRNGPPAVRILDDSNALVYYTWQVDWYRPNGRSNLNDVGMMTISAQKRGGRWYWIALTSQRLPAYVDQVIHPNGTR